MREQLRPVCRGLGALAMAASTAFIPVHTTVAQPGISLSSGWQHTVIGLPGNCGRGQSRIFQGGAGLVLFDDCDMEMLTSSDGTTWHQIALPPLQLEDVLNWDFFAAGPLFLLYGTSFALQPGPTPLSLWASPDGGKTWKKGSSDLQINSVTAGGDGLLAAARSPGSFNASLWTSADGLTWKPLPDPAGVFESADVRLVVHGEFGWFAGGAVGGGIPVPRTPALWSSTDGRTWTRGAIADLPQDSNIASIVAGPKGIVAILNVTNGTAVLASSDGQHWRQATAIPSGNFYYYFGTTSIAAWQDGFIWLADEGGEAVVWSSTDGLTWTRVGGDELFGGTVQISDMVSFNGGVVAVGGFATHPQPACTRAPGSDQGDLRSFRTATIQWIPAQSTAPSPIDRTDPQLSKLLPSDLGTSAGKSTDLGSYRTAYVNLCVEDSALGLHRAYRVSIPTGPGGAPGVPPNLPGQELTIVAQSATGAHSAFIQARRWMFAGATPKSEHISVRIGDETSAFSFSLPADVLPPGIPVKAHVVIWRRDRVIGEIYTTNLHAARTLAQKQFDHMENLSTAGVRQEADR